MTTPGALFLTVKSGGGPLGTTKSLNVSFQVVITSLPELPL